MRALIWAMAVPPRPVVTRCCDDVPPRGASTSSSDAVPGRWVHKLAVAVPASLRVFRRELRQPAVPAVASGTPVVTPSGRKIGTVHDVVVEVRSGRTSYAVLTDEPHDEPGRVLLLPREALRTRRNVAVVDDGLVGPGERRIA
jgi:sporulation protein YlmC with PRC-barrel domain